MLKVVVVIKALTFYFFVFFAGQRQILMQVLGLIMPLTTQVHRTLHFLHRRPRDLITDQLILPQLADLRR